MVRLTVVNGVWRACKVNVWLASSANVTFRERLCSFRWARVRRRPVNCHVAAGSPECFVVALEKKIQYIAVAYTQLTLTIQGTQLQQYRSH